MADCDCNTAPHPPVYEQVFVRPPLLQTCPVCGERFSEESKRGPKAKTCSSKCAELSRNAGHGNLARVENGVAIYSCLYCKQEFNGRSRKYCSKPCKNKARVRKDGHTPSGRKRLLPTPIIDGKRECLKCGVVKKLGEFTKTKNSKSGYQSTCMDCSRKDAALRKRARDATQEGKKKRQKERARMAEKRGRKYTPGGPDANRTPLSVLQARLAKINARQAWHWWLANAPDNWVAAYYDALGQPWKNPRLTDAERYRLHYTLDLEFNLKERIRRQHTKKAKRDGIQEIIRSAIQRNGRSRKVEERCGYTIAELKAHLERQFTRGMNWDRFMAGDIHIDHIIPQREFDLQDDEQWRKCWCLSNLQPLWAKDNLEKRDRVLYLI